MVGETISHYRVLEKTRQGFVVLGALLVTLMVLFGCGGTGTGSQSGAPTFASTAIDDAALSLADERVGDWLTQGRTYSEQRFSPLDQINGQNVDQLGLAWSFETGTDRGLEATPIVVDGIMYTSGSWSVVFAVDARTGELLWKYDPKVSPEYGKKACCDVVNRGVALYRGKIYVGILDGRLAALDAQTGELVWEVVTVDQSQNYTITGAPRIVKGQVIIGNGGAEYGVRGYVSAYDAETGTLTWRFYTVPGDPSKPFESEALERAAETWKGNMWWIYGGGGTVWDSLAFDPELDLLYVGTGNGSPWNREIRSPGGGDNLYLASILALDPDDGELVWYYQTTPGESWDYTATQHMILAELTLAGVARKVLMQAPKNGFFYVLDRETGELLSADAYVEVTWAERVDIETGRPVETSGSRYLERGVQIRPSTLGGHNWQPMSYNPQTGLVYIPAQEHARYFEQDLQFDYRPGQLNLGAISEIRKRPPDDILKQEWPYQGHLLAWDPVRGEERWRVEYEHYWNGGTLTTAGNLVFQGTAAGYFIAYAANDGEKLWDSWVGTGVLAAPVAYQIEGVQYVSVMAGWGGARFNGVKNVGRILTFALGGAADSPPRHELPPVQVISQTAGPETLAEGAENFRVFCSRCHGGGTTLPDLRYSSEGVFGSYLEIVLEGALADRAMRPFKGRLTEKQVLAIRAYVLEERRKIASRSE
ncbi:MAG: PQQ-dependent dehydrogenase, methanol/ethanol family [Acidobacteriota bacterium]